MTPLVVPPRPLPFESESNWEQLMKKTYLAAAAALLMATAALAAPSAAFAEGHNPEIIPGGQYNRPADPDGVEQLDVDASGTVFTASTSANPGTIAKTTAIGAVTRLASNSLYTYLPSVVAQRNGIVYYTTAYPIENPREQDSVAVMSVPATGGTPRLVADLSTWEKTHTPDAQNTYGFVGLPQECADQFGQFRDAPLAVRHGSTYYVPSAMVATSTGLYITDFGRSAVIRVGYDGAISTTAVLPPESTIVASDPALLSYYAAPDCALGYKFIPEGQPTGIAQGPDGNLYVTTIPSGWASYAASLKGGLYRINPATGALKRIIGSLKAPTGVTATPSGTLYVAEYRGGTSGGGGVSVVRVNSQVARPLVNTPSPEAIRFVKDKLYVANGGITVIPLTYK